MTFALEAYLTRLGGLSRPIDRSSLISLQRAQMSTIPFENIDVLLGGIPSLDPDRLWNKLGPGARGGYCFELNTLFAWALRDLGLEPTPVLGRVRMGAPVGGARTHLAHVVVLDGCEWLFDAGFGGPGPRDPICLTHHEPQQIADAVFRVRPDPHTNETVLERHREDGWFSLYGFDRARVTPLDIEAANVTCARWEKSPFPRHLMMSISTEQEQVSVLNTTVSRSRDGVLSKTDITTVEALAGVLGDDYRLPDPAGLATLVWSKLQPARSA